MSMKKKQVRRTEGYRNKHGGNRGNEHCLYVRVFPGMSLAFICFMLLFGGIGVVSASVTYDTSTNTIYLEDGTNTLASIYTEINDPSVLSYDSGTNIYTLSAYICGKSSTNADLLLDDTTLVFDSTAVDKYYIKTYCDISIENMTIEAANPSYPWKIWVYAKWTSYSIKITDSDLSGGQILAQPEGAASTPAVIKNNYFHDFTINDIFDDYALALKQGAGRNAYIYNNTFDNIHITGSNNPGAGVLQAFSSANVTIDKIYFSNCSVNPTFRGMIHFYGGTDGSTVSNFEIKDCIGSGLTGKEYKGLTYRNGTIKNISEYGIVLNLEPRYGTTLYSIRDVNIDGASRGICGWAYEGHTADIYNVRINNTGVAFRRGAYSEDNSIHYITNSKATNYGTLHEVTSAEIRRYELVDIHVVDKKGNPVESATVTIEAVNPDVSKCSINRKLEALTQTETLLNGHTPLPAEDETNTVALLSRRVTKSTDKTYTYTITAEKDGYTETVTVDPDESWYREDPHTYPEVGKGTVIITLPLTSETGTISGTVKDTNGGFIANATVSDGARSATTDENGDYTITDVPAGIYTVTSTRTGYQDASKANVAVSGEAPSIVDLTLEDTFSPYTSGISPAKAATGVSRDTNIVVHIIDDGSGVDQSTLVMTVAGTPVSPTITDTANDYTVTYTPPTPFEYEQVVDVTIAAQDLVTPANVMTTDSYAFTILSEQQSLIITNVNVASITTNSATITWDTNEEADTKVTYDTNPASLGTVWKNNSVLTKTHSITLTRLDDDTTYYYKVYSTDASENTANSTICNFITLPVLPGNDTVLIQAQGDVTDNRLRDAIPDAVLDSTDFIDVGRIDSEGNYRDVIWFDLSQLNSTAVIKSAKLSLFWYYVTGTRNTSTTVEIYRPVDWAETYVTWNSRTDGVAWNNLGGDWYDRTNVAQGDTPYAAVTLPLGAPDNAYHEFDVTELVQSYVDGLYENTGFFIKANEVSDSYIAFRSSDWTNADERPKLVVSYSLDPSLEDTIPPASISNLQNTTGTTWINWAWTNPTDTDFSYTMVYLNGLWQTNTSNTYYTATGLIANTSYEIGTHTVDTHGNVNATWVNQTTKTEVEPDTTSPNITNVNVASITTNSATITWDTNEEADTKVTYDTNPASLGTVWKNNSVLTKTHSITLTRLDDDTTYYYKVYSTDASENTANSTICNFITLPVLPGNDTVLIQAQGDVTDNRLRDAIPDAVLDSTDFIDVGRIDSEGNYRDVIWFDLSQLNSTAVIKSAKLSLFWYYVTGTRNTSTTVEIYRPVDWAETYVTWNSRTDGVAWNNLGGDWYDRTNVAQGDTPYAAVTLPLGAPDNAYHEFDVTELVQSYVDGLYENTGFFIKANEVSDSYIAFRSSDWTNADERPKLVVSYGSGDAQQNTISGTVTTLDSAGIANATATLTTLEGAEIATTQTDINGNYTFADIATGDYNISVSKLRFWPTTITVNTGDVLSKDVMLWLKGDLNLNGESADSDDLKLMEYAATGSLIPDWKFDLNTNGEFACAGDVLMLEEAAAGKIELW